MIQLNNEFLIDRKYIVGHLGSLSIIDITFDYSW